MIKVEDFYTGETFEDQNTKFHVLDKAKLLEAFADPQFENNGGQYSRKILHVFAKEAGGADLQIKARGPNPEGEIIHFIINNNREHPIAIKGPATIEGGGSEAIQGTPKTLRGKAPDGTEVKIKISDAVIPPDQSEVERLEGESGEFIITEYNGKPETVSFAYKGDTIYTQKLLYPDGTSKVERYVPPDGQKYLEDNYKKVPKETQDPRDADMSKFGAEYEPAPDKPLTKIMYKVVGKEPVVILDAFGPGRHQFLYEGAVIKEDFDGKRSRPTGVNWPAWYASWGEPVGKAELPEEVREMDTTKSTGNYIERIQQEQANRGRGGRKL